MMVVFKTSHFLQIKMSYIQIQLKPAVHTDCSLNRTTFFQILSTTGFIFVNILFKQISAGLHYNYFAAQFADFF